MEGEGLGRNKIGHRRSGEDSLLVGTKRAERDLGPT